VAICAGCQQSLAKGEPFVLAGTEVLHKRCAPLVAAGQTALQRARAHHRAAHQDVIAARNDASQFRRDRDEARDLAAKLQRVVDEQAVTIESRNRRLSSDRVTIDALRAESDRLRRRGNELEQQLALEERERRELLREIAARQNVPSPATVTPERDTRDGTEIRFSLLELDKP
jgi:septal ring factor EnvC (AmiA/AmiB activator)